MPMTEFIRPFGPTIYKNRLAKDQIDFLQDVAKLTKQARNDVSATLVGNIEDQLGCFLKSKKDHDKFYDIMKYHLIEYVNYEHNRKIRTFSKGDPVKVIDLQLDYGQGPWINFQQAGEFNSVHSHTGEISAVVYIDIPKEINNEVNVPGCGHPDAPGQIEFIYGIDGCGSYGSIPQEAITGDIYLFPSLLKHTVYPFRSDVTRISMSFNINNYSPITEQESK